MLRSFLKSTGTQRPLAKQDDAEEDHVRLARGDVSLDLFSSKTQDNVVHIMPAFTVASGIGLIDQLQNGNTLGAAALTVATFGGAFVSFVGYANRGEKEMEILLFEGSQLHLKRLADLEIVAHKVFYVPHLKINLDTERQRIQLSDGQTEAHLGVFSRPTSEELIRATELLQKATDHINTTGPWGPRIKNDERRGNDGDDIGLAAA